MSLLLQCLISFFVLLGVLEVAGNPIIHNIHEKALRHRLNSSRSVGHSVAECGPDAAIPGASCPGNACCSYVQELFRVLHMINHNDTVNGASAARLVSIAVQDADQIVPRQRIRQAISWILPSKANSKQRKSLLRQLSGHVACQAPH